MKDRRVEKTLALIEQTFLLLTEEKDVPQITVKEICERANINRCTFYAHYLDINDLMSKLEQKVVDEYLAVMGQYKYDTDGAGIIIQFLLFVYENPKLFKLFFNESSPGAGWQAIYTTIEKKTIPMWLQESTVSEDQAEMIFRYMMNGTYAILESWYNSGFSMDVKSIEGLIENLSKYGVYHFIYTK